MLYNVSLQDFGPHENFQHDFSEGITLVLGPNGSGKSNVLYGVGWTIFGFKALPPEYNQADIIRDGAKVVSGQVTLDLLGQPHTFRRTYDGKNVQAEVLRGDEQVATGARGVEEFLGMYGITWQSASVLFSRQRELDAFVYETPAKRKEIFESLLQVEVVNDARKIARLRQKDNTEDVPMILTVTNSVDAAADIENHVHMLAIELAEAERLEAEHSASIIARDAALDVITRASNDEEARTFQTNMRQAQDEIYKLNKRLDQINPTILSAPFLTPEDVVQYQSSIKTLEASIAQARIDLELAVKQEDLLRNERGENLGWIESLQGTLRLLKDGLCPTCGSNIDDPLEHVAAVHNVSLSDLEAKRDDIRERWLLVQTSINIFQDEIDMREKKRIDQSSELTTFNYAVSLIPEAKDLNQQITQRKELVKEWEDKIRGLSGPSQEQRDTFAHADEVTTKLSTLARSAREDAHRRQTVLNENRQILVEVIAAEVKVVSSEATRKVWATVSKAMDEFRNQVLQSALNWVSLRATQIVRMIGTLPESGPSVRLSLDKDLQFWFTTGDKDTPVYRFSGGQKAVFAICLRMALSEYFSDRLGLKGFLLLDAVLDSLTEDNQQATATALQALGPQQAVIFSHFDVEGLDVSRVRL